MKIEVVDSNFLPATVGGLDVCYHDALKAPFVLEGFPWRDPEMVFNRLPASFSENEVNAGALATARLTAGGAIRFRTDSPCLTLRAVLDRSGDMNHMPRAGSAGFDFYSGSGSRIQYRTTVKPDHGQKELETLLVNDGSGPVAMTDWTCLLPLYGAATRIEIGLKPGSGLEKPTPHTIAKPVLFYGSSITQGGCASRPGNAYTTMLCRAVDAAQINLGFSGCGRGEPAVADAIAGLDLAVFVLDYDHNAPTVGHLQETHERFFRIIRARQPELPVILMSRCDFYGTTEDRRRREVIRQTYANAVAAGDRKVWFLDGEALFETEHRDACTVDGCHPNDLGFYRMFRTALPVLETALRA